MSDLLSYESVTRHADAWADTHDGYNVKRQYVLRCLWCDYTVMGDTAKIATARYKKEHEKPIIDELKRLADED